MNATLFLLASLAGASSDSMRIPVAPAESLRVVVAGAGAPVVLIPGLVGTAFSYRHLVAPLAEDGWLVIVIEPLGIGGSSRPKRADYSLTAQADRIAAVLDTLGVGSAVVVAHSISGTIALRLAYRHPDRVRAVVSLEGGAAESATRVGFRRLMGLAPVLKHLGGSELLRSFMIREMKAASADTSWIDEVVIRGYTAEATAAVGATLGAYQAMSRSEEPEPLADHLVEVRVPVSLLLGEAPHGSAPAAAELAKLRDSLPALSVEQVPGAGHFIHEERPDAVLAAIARFRPLAQAAAATR